MSFVGLAFIRQQDCRHCQFHSPLIKLQVWIGFGSSNDRVRIESKLTLSRVTDVATWLVVMHDHRFLMGGQGWG
jgi:hypothetical protein